jgi:hypothetical protein
LTIRAPSRFAKLNNFISFSAPSAPLREKIFLRMSDFGRACKDKQTFASCSLSIAFSGLPVHREKIQKTLTYLLTFPILRVTSPKMSDLQPQAGRLKRQRTGALQNASRRGWDIEMRASVLECGGPPPLSPSPSQLDF